MEHVGLLLLQGGHLGLTSLIKIYLVSFPPDDSPPNLGPATDHKYLTWTRNYKQAPLEVLIRDLCSTARVRLL